MPSSGCQPKMMSTVLLEVFSQVAFSGHLLFYVIDGLLYIVVSNFTFIAIFLCEYAYLRDFSCFL